MSEQQRIEITVRLWSTGDDDSFEEYITALTALLPRSHGEFVRRIGPVEHRTSEPDAVLVLSFPDATSVEAFLRDPRRDDLEDLSIDAVTRSLITDGRTRDTSESSGTIHQLPHRDNPD